MKLSAKTPTSEFVIQGVKFQVPAPFKEGHTCTSNEAAVLNQTLAENIRNNRSGMVDKAKAEAEKAGTEVDLVALQKALDDYITEYEFGVRRGGGFRASDPVEKEAMNIAKEKVKEALLKRGTKLSEVTAANITELAAGVLKKYPAITEQAKVTVAAREAAATDLVIEI